MLSPLPCVLLLTSAAIMLQFLPSSILTRLPQSLFACPGDTAFLKSQPVLHSRSRYCLRQSKACCRHSRWSFVNVSPVSRRRTTSSFFARCLTLVFTKDLFFKSITSPETQIRAHMEWTDPTSCALFYAYGHCCFQFLSPGRRGSVPR